MMQQAGLTADVMVVGAGPVGLTAAIALSDAGLDTILVARRAPVDNRTTALLASSVTALETLGVWTHAAAHAAPLRTLRIVDDTARLIRAPEARFEAHEIGLPSFGDNIENRHLVAALETRAAELTSLRRIEDEADAVDIADDYVVVRLKGGQRVTARLAVGADGRKSICRMAAGIETTGWSYPQVALTFIIAHSRPHQDISTEFHTESGPFTLVPLREQRSSIVCVVDPAEGELLRGLGTEDLERELERRTHSILGRICVEPGQGYFPLAVETARTLATRRVALAGEAAHRIPPIGAQGLNLGLRDAAFLAELVAQARTNGDDVGNAELLAQYDRARRADITSRTFAVDLLNRTLLSGFLPLQGARGLGVYLMNRVGPLRRAVMREGIAPATAQPRLMRGEMLERAALR
jgi:2-octaprenyl-6-methoxyphenol hydroxylase